MPTDQLMTSPWIVAGESDSAFEQLLRPYGVERHYQNGASLYEQGEMVPGLFYLLAARSSSCSSAATVPSGC